MTVEVGEPSKTFRSDFAREVFSKIGAATNNYERIVFGVAWAAFENTQAANNPWATTEPFEGATDFNEAGVKNYLTFENGVDATVATLENGNYEHLLEVLRSGDTTIQDVLNALNSSPWGSTVTTELFNEVSANYGAYDKLVADSDGDVEPPVVAPPVTPPKPTEAQVDAAEVVRIEQHEEMTKELPELKYGSAGKPVITLTSILHVLSSGQCPVTSEFNRVVEGHVREYQKSTDITEDGIVGPETWSSFFV